MREHQIHTSTNRELSGWVGTSPFTCVIVEDYIFTVAGTKGRDGRWWKMNDDADKSRRESIGLWGK